MMIFKNYSFLFLPLLWVLYSCNTSSSSFTLSDGDSTIELVSIDKELEGFTLENIENKDGLYTDIRYFNKKLFLLNSRDSFAIDVIDISTGYVITKIGSIGGVDANFANIETLKLIDVDTIVQIYDYYSKSLSLFDSMTGKLVREIPIPDEYATTQSARLIQDDIVAIVDLQSNYEFILTKNGRVMGSTDFHVSQAVCPLMDLKPRDTAVSYTHLTLPTIYSV